MRDAWNLAWRLGMILDGKARDDLLESYQAERLPHLRQLTEMSIFLGKIICIPDAAAAAERDKAFFEGNHPSFPGHPILAHGLIRRDSSGVPLPGAGELSPHATIAFEGRQGRLDDIVGPGFVLMTRSQIQLPDSLTRFPLHILQITNHAGPGWAVDLSNMLLPFLDARNWSAMIVRPDYYIYGGATEADVADLLNDFAADLNAHGFL